MSKKLITLLTVILVLIVVIFYYVWLNSDAVIVGKNSFTHKEINNLYTVENNLANIIGNNVVEDEIDVLYNLIIASIQKDILVKNGLDLNKVDKARNTKLIESGRDLKDFYSDTAVFLGKDDYYRLVIEPAIISKMFYQFYQNSNIAANNAKKVLNLLRTNSIKNVENEFKIKAFNLNIPKSNVALLKDLDNKIGLYDKVIELNDNFIVAKVVGYDEKNIITQSFIFKRLGYIDFFTKVLDKNNIEFPFYSLYKKGDIINKKGSILK